MKKLSFLVLFALVSGYVYGQNWTNFTSSQVCLSSSASAGMEVAGVRWDKGSAVYNEAYLILVDSNTGTLDGTVGTDEIDGLQYSISRYPLAQHLTCPIMMFSTASATGLYTPSENYVDLTDPVTGRGLTFENGLCVFKTGAGASAAEVSILIRKKLDRSQMR